MTGLAQRKFYERTSKSLSNGLERICQWPFLEKMLIANHLGYVDLALAHQLLGLNADESFAALICHLSMASRSGHVCVKIDKDTIIPAVNDIWLEGTSEHSQDIFLADFQYLTQLILKGIKKAPPTLIGDVNTTKELTQAPILKNHHSYYLQRYWHLETALLRNMERFLLENRETFFIDQKIVDSKISLLLNEKKLLKEQARAISMAFQSPLTLITGGPGTGKTYTAGLLISTLCEAAFVDKGLSLKVVLAAPTGKAAANLEASIKNALALVKRSTVIKAQTLHQLLGIRKNVAHFNPITLTADLIVVDESSMIDIALMGQLFSAIKPGTRLVLIGDRHQLPSVEAGSLFADLTNHFLANKEPLANVVELKTCMRSELKSINDLADQIKSGNDFGALNLLNTQSEGIKLVQLDEKLSVKEQQKRLVNDIIPYFPVIAKPPEDPLELLESFSRFRLLTPMREGPFGVDTLNALILQTISAKITQKAYFVAPIMVMQNDYHRDLFNGEVGVIVKQQESEFALFASREPGKAIRKIPLLLMPRFEYAYCLSIHKSQGSEFDHVALLLSEGAQNFGREALYTGVTRAKRRLEIWSRPQVLSQMMKYVASRQSGIIERRT